MNCGWPFLQNVPVGCRQPMGSMRANGIRVYTPTGMVRALMKVGRSRSAIPALTNFGDLVDAVRLMGVDAVAGGRRHNVQCG